MRQGFRGQRLFIVSGVLLVGLGLVSIVRPFFVLNERSAADQAALKAWQLGNELNLQGPAHGQKGTLTSAAIPCKSAASGDGYALVTFPSLATYGYAGVAVDTDWNGLEARSMVHWQGSAAPGAQGNVIIAFHREPDYEHIDQLSTGQIVTVEDRSCQTYSYQITSRQELAPNRVTQLAQTSGYNLTMITCTPFFQDYNRLVWQATLVAKNGQPFAG